MKMPGRYQTDLPLYSTSVTFENSHDQKSARGCRSVQDSALENKGAGGSDTVGVLLTPTTAKLLDEK